MKKYLIPTAAVVVAAVLGTPYYLGVKAEESLTEQQKLLQESGFLTVESHQYDRGWFSSTETTVIRLKPTLFQNTQKYLPDNLKTVLQEPITVINHVTHGPFAGGFGTRAHVETEFQYHPETKKVLDRFFGQQTPLTMTNTVYLSGDGKLSLNIPASTMKSFPVSSSTGKVLAAIPITAKASKAIATITLRRLYKSNWPIKAMCLWKTCASNPKRKTA